MGATSPIGPTRPELPAGRPPLDVLERHRSLRVLIGFVLVILAVVLAQLAWSALVLFGDIILLFFLAWIVSFILDPVSLYLRRLGINRVLSVTLIYTALLVVISGGIVLTIPIIADEAKYLSREMTDALSATNINQLGSGAYDLLIRAGFKPGDAQNIVNQASSQVPQFVSNLGGQAVASATTLVTSVLGILFNTFLILILSFYMMLDGDRLIERFVLKLPPVWLPYVRLFQRNVEQIFGGFFRAQLTIGAIYGALTWFLLLILGQANGLLVALAAGIIMLLPLIGPPLSIVPPVALVLLQSDPSQVAGKLIVLVLLLIVAQNVVMQLIAPHVFRTTMGVHPLIIFGALLVGAKFGGVWGAFFAGPIVGVVYAMLAVAYERWAKSSSLFDPPERPETPPALRAPDDTGQPAEPARRTSSI